MKIDEILGENDKQNNKKLMMKCQKYFEKV